MAVDFRFADEDDCQLEVDYYGGRGVVIETKELDNHAGAMVFVPKHALAELITILQAIHERMPK